MIVGGRGSRYQGTNSIIDYSMGNCGSKLILNTTQAHTELNLYIYVCSYGFSLSMPESLHHTKC